MFGGDFGDQIGRFATLTDPKAHQFEVLVESINGDFFLTKRWKAIRDFYGIGLGAWVTLVFVDEGRFYMMLSDRFHKTIKYPVFDPPMHFLIDRTNVQTTFNHHLPPITSLLSYRHNISYMFIDFQKKLSEYDVTKDFFGMIHFSYKHDFFFSFSFSRCKLLQFSTLYIYRYARVNVLVLIILFTFLINKCININLIIIYN